MESMYVINRRKGSFLMAAGSPLVDELLGRKTE